MKICSDSDNNSFTLNLDSDTGSSEQEDSEPSGSNHVNSQGSGSTDVGSSHSIWNLPGQSNFHFEERETNEYIDQNDALYQKFCREYIKKECGTFNPVKRKLPSAGDFAYKADYFNDKLDDENQDVNSIMEAIITSFLSDDIIKTICENTNNFSRLRGSHIRNIHPGELVVFIAILLYMGIYKLTTHTLWIQEDVSPLHTISQYMSKQRFKDMKSILCIGNLKANGPFKKVDLLYQHIKAMSKHLAFVGQNIAIDEMMIKFNGRSRSTVRAAHKRISTCYKVYSICDRNGYIHEFEFMDPIKKTSRLRELTATEALVM